MGATSKTFRIFVSSTFSDLKAERNALQERVFPKLRELCMQHGCRFQAIDLRWGVSQEASLDQQTMNICLQELKRCQKVTPRPNFIVLLGDRYGWRPLPPQIEASEFEEILRKVSPKDEELLLWEEAQPEEKKGWYQKDENAVPAEYCLQPRKVVVPDDASDEERQAARETEAREWEQTESRLRLILLRAIDELEWAEDDPRRVKYEASATHLAILEGAMSVPDAAEHVFGFFREIGNVDDVVTDAGQAEAAKDFLDLGKNQHLDGEARGRLETLKQQLHARLPNNIFKYEATWTGSGIRTDHLDKLCEDVYDSLSRVIVQEASALEEADPLEKETKDQESFGKERAKFFVGRVGILQTIRDYLRSGDAHPLVMSGVSGSGKTALMARVAREAKKWCPGADVIFRFIGATPSSSDGRSLLENLCRQISRRYEADESELPTEYRKLVEEFPKRLGLATEKKPLILFLDALDQLSDADNARHLTWLPGKLPDNVRLVVSTLPGGCLEVLERKVPPECFVGLKPMSAAEGEDLLGFWLRDVKRKLQPHQREGVLEKFERCGLPLYLKLAFEEARRWKSYNDRQSTSLSPDIPGIIRDLFDVLSDEANHGAMMVSRSLGNLAAARHGLTEDEILDVLSRDGEVMGDFKRRSPKSPDVQTLPVIVWSRLYFDLEPYLAERSADGTSLLTFYHRQLLEAVEGTFLAEEARRDRHRGLAKYFADQPLQIGREDKKRSNLRKVSEQPHQQTHGEMWGELETTLTDLRFSETKCAAGMTYDLVRDYHAALDSLPEAQEEKRKEQEHEERVRRYTEEIVAYARDWNDARKRHAEDPETYPMPKPEDIPFPEIIPSVRLWTDEDIGKDRERIINNPTRLDRIRAFSQFLTGGGHMLTEYGSHPGFCLKQAYNCRTSGPVAQSAERLVELQRKDPLLLRILSKLPEYNPHPALLQTIEGRSWWVRSVSVTPDGKRAVSGGDRTVRVWDLEGGECIAIWSAASDVASLSQITAEGRVACGTGNGEVILLKLQNMSFDTPLVTGVRVWLFSTCGQGGRWERSVKAVCPWCGNRFPVTEEILNVIRVLTRGANLKDNQSPCLELPREAWDEPRLLSECPLCHKPLKFNPFIVDNRDRY